MRKNPEKCPKFSEKPSPEFSRGWIWSNLTFDLLKYLSGNSLVQLLSSKGSSLFHNISCQFPHFYDYVIDHDVIGHDVIGHPDISTESSSVGLVDVVNRLAIPSLWKKIWLNWNGMILSRKNGSKILSFTLALNKSISESFFKNMFCSTAPPRQPRGLFCSWPSWSIKIFHNCVFTDMVHES